MIVKSRWVWSVGFLFASLACALGAEPGEYHVVQLRADEVTLTPDRGKPISFRREKFHGSWAIVDHDASGDLKVKVDGKIYTIAAVDVLTDEPKAARSCINKSVQKPGGVRGFGEPCKP